jgi:hypothetical protein
LTRDFAGKKREDSLKCRSIYRISNDEAKQATANTGILHYVQDDDVKELRINRVSLEVFGEVLSWGERPWGRGPKGHGVWTESGDIEGWMIDRGSARDIRRGWGAGLSRRLRGLA